MRRVGALIGMAALLVATSNLARAAQSDDSRPASCFVKMQLPSYPLLARQARIAGTFQTSVELDDEGHVLRVASRSNASYSQVKTILYPAVEASIRASIFSRSCANQTLTMVYHFVLGEGAASKSPRDTLWFSYPNEFFVSTSPEFYQPGRTQ